MQETAAVAAVVVVCHYCFPRTVAWCCGSNAMVAVTRQRERERNQKKCSSRYGRMGNVERAMETKEKRGATN